MKILFSMLRLMLALVVGLSSLIVTSLVMVLIHALVLVGVMWAWIHGSWTFRNGPKPAASDVVDVQVHEVAATKTPQTLQQTQRLPTGIAMW